MVRKSSYSKQELLRGAKGDLFGPAAGKLPLPPLLMVDRITLISDEGGTFDKGSIVAEMDVEASHWFFNCHFKDDP